MQEIIWTREKDDLYHTLDRQTRMQQLAMERISMIVELDPSKEEVGLDVPLAIAEMYALSYDRLELWLWRCIGLVFLFHVEVLPIWPSQPARYLDLCVCRLSTPIENILAMRRLEQLRVQCCLVDGDERAGDFVCTRKGFKSIQQWEQEQDVAAPCVEWEMTWTSLGPFASEMARYAKVLHLEMEDEHMDLRHLPHLQQVTCSSPSCTVQVRPGVSVVKTHAKEKSERAKS